MSIPSRRRGARTRRRPVHEPRREGRRYRSGARPWRSPRLPRRGRRADGAFSSGDAMPCSEDASSSDSRPSPAPRSPTLPSQHVPVASPAPAAARTARSWCLQMRPGASSRRVDARRTLAISETLASCRALCAPPSADLRLSSPGTEETPLPKEAPL